jgi:L-seryl-tRNA(Ser) seleniumtransferase
LDFHPYLFILERRHHPVHSFSQESIVSANVSMRDVPSIGTLLDDPGVKRRFRKYSRKMCAEAMRRVADRWRQIIRQGKKPSPRGATRGAFLDQVSEVLETTARPSLRPVINATGVVLNTNLGRAPLAPEAIEQIRLVSSGYCNLEAALDTGSRGRRGDHVDRLLVRLSRAPAALVVNNNAAAVMLILNTFAQGREVIVSRGELIEIGGSFRLPDVMSASGARLVEVGTTNRTYLKDYQKAVNAETAMLFRSHTSNYQVVGFTHRPSLEELVRLGRRKKLLTVEDLGSGLLHDFGSQDLADEPTLRWAVRSGADLVCFSGDKLLGGPQCGIIVGRQRLLSQLRQNPMSRAMRVGKMTLSALEAVLRQYLYEDHPEDVIPHLKMIRQPASAVRERARRLLRQLRPAFGDRVEARLINGHSAIGGGSDPGGCLATCLIALRIKGMPPARAARLLRTGDPPVIGRIGGHRLLLDLRTVSSGEMSGLRAALTGLCRHIERG